MCCLKALPPFVFRRLGQFTSLEEIVICDHWENTQGHSRPQTFVQSICSHFPFVKKLVIRCGFDELPKQLLHLECLETLELLRCHDLKRMGTAAGGGLLGAPNMQPNMHLRALRLRYCRPRIMRDLFRLFPNIQELYLESCNGEIPKEIENLANLESLTIIYATKLKSTP
jgi:hypothetical protein